MEQIAQGTSLLFIDDVGVKPTTRSFYRRGNNGGNDDNRGYNGDSEFEEVLPGVRKYVMEAIISLDQNLANIEPFGGTISGEKSEFLMDGIKMVAFVCGSNGRTPEEAKIRKIINWRPCESVTEFKGFSGICVYYRIWIKDFSVHANTLYQLMHGKNQVFN